MTRVAVSYDRSRHPVEVSPDDPVIVDTRRADSAVELPECDVFLTVDEITARYRVGRTRAYQLIHEAWFPPPVIAKPYRWSLASLRRAEASRATGRAIRSVEPPTPRRRRPARSAR